jgi:ABC-type antimicrobial peptide transport system permease subunit
MNDLKFALRQLARNPGFTAGGIKLTLAGLGLGLVAALALTRVMGSLLYEVRPGDPITYFGVSGLLLAVGLLASWLPARLATRVDPIQSLRYE